MERPIRQAAQRATRLLFGDFAEDEISDGEEDIILSDNDSTMSVEEEAATTLPRDTHMKSRDGSEIWHRGPLSVERQHRAHDILREAQGPTRQAIRSGCGDSASQSFKLFLSSDLVGSIVQHTNEEGLRNDPTWKCTTTEEIYKFVGLLLLAGVYRAKHEPIEQLWNQTHGRPIFNKAMSRDR